jgi:hypothetical protein
LEEFTIFGFRSSTADEVRDDEETDVKSSEEEDRQEASEFWISATAASRSEGAAEFLRRGEIRE